MLINKIFTFRTNQTMKYATSGELNLLIECKDAAEYGVYCKINAKAKT
jgi:hypothetical protein